MSYEIATRVAQAYKYGDGRKIDGRRVLVDVERGRTVPNWRPRRIGGGLGGTRKGGDDVNVRHSGREPAGGGSSECPLFSALTPRLLHCTLFS
jgi:U1 small nuclear ribonucleoprotein